MMVDINASAFEGQELAYTGEAITSTTKKTNWGVNVWRQWAAKAGETRPLETVSFDQLNKLLCRFYAEICKVSGEPYEAECLRLMRKSIERYLQENTIGEVSLKRDPTFRESNVVLKQRMRALMLRGNRKQQLVQINISAKEEELLWRSGQLGNQSALALLNVNLLNLVKRMGIKGRKDLYMLRVEDFEVREAEPGTCQVICTKPSAGGTENLRSMVAVNNDAEKCPVYLFREFLRHRPKHMRGIGPLFLALSNFTTDADVWYRPVRLSEATLGSIIRQMANAARTMGLSGMQNLNTEQKPKNGTAPANNNRSEVENSPANNQNSKNSNQVMGSFSTTNSTPFDENSYLSLADASILAQYYGDKGSGYPPTMARCNSTTTRGYPPTMVRSNMVDVKTAQDNIKLTPENLLQSLATSLNSPEFSSAVATSLTNLQNPGLIAGGQLLMQPTPLLSVPILPIQSSVTVSSPAPNVVITSTPAPQHYTTPSLFAGHAKSPENKYQTPNMSTVSPEITSPPNTTTPVTSPPSESVIKDCTINISSKVSGSVKQEQMDYTDFLNKNANSFDHDNKIMHTEIKDIMCVLKQGSARFVNCTFNFNFPR